MFPQRIEDSYNTGSERPPEPQQETRRRRHHRRSFYSQYIRPYRRELRTAILFCIFVFITYLIWNLLAAN